MRVAGLALAWLALFGAPATQAQRAPIAELDRIVAVVNDDVIVESELRERLRTAREQIRESGFAAPSTSELQRQVLERLIIERLELQAASRSGIRIEDESLNRAIERIAARNQLTLREFRDVLERDGYDFAQFRERIRNEMLISRLRRDQVESRIRVSDRDIDNFLATRAKQQGGGTEYHVAQILVALPDAASPEQIADARDRVSAIADELAGGADFARVAAARSDGQQALAGGDLGWRKQLDLPTLFADQVPAMEVGEVIGPLRSGSGFHLVKLLASRDQERHVVRETHARHILVRPGELLSDDEARTRLEQIRLRLEGGEDFAALARAHSDDPASAAKGGDLGWISTGDVVPEFQARMDALESGGLSEPFRTEFGWHLLEVLERRDRDDTERAQRNAAREQIRQRKVEEEAQAWLRQLRDEAYVKYQLDE